jgi:hypothetical protein
MSEWARGDLATEYIVSNARALIGAPVCATTLVKIPAQFSGVDIGRGRTLEEGWAHGSLMVKRARVAKPFLEARKQDAELTGTLDALRELARGIHPSVLAKGRLSRALTTLTTLTTLARRSAVPVDLDVRIDGRLPEQVEIAAYYLVSEA